MSAILAMPEAAAASPVRTPSTPPAPAGSACALRPQLAGVSIAELLYRMLHEWVIEAALNDPEPS